MSDDSNFVKFLEALADRYDRLAEQWNAVGQAFQAKSMRVEAAAARRAAKEIAAEQER